MLLTPQTGTGKQLVPQVGQASWAPGVVAHTCNPRNGQPEAGGSQVWGHPGLNSKILSPIKKR